MRQRCYDENCKLYHYYGARGISVCDEWLSAYLNFKSWALTNGFQEHLVIDRIDTYGNYEPANCRWITQKENCRNTRSNHIVTAFGETKCLAEWAEDARCQVKYGTLWRRIANLEWEPELAIAQPLT